jgi:ATP-dependent Clp protease ATP-binding subunit ClpA
MKFEKFTVKAREVIADAQNLAGRLGNPEIRPGHLLAAMIEQENGVANSIIRSAGADPDRINQDVAVLVDGYSKVSGGSKAGISRELQAALDNSEQAAKNNGDSHVSVEMLLLGDLVDAEAAAAWGLVNAVVPPGEALAAAHDMARRIAAKSTRIVKIGKEAFYRQIDMPVAEAYRYAAEVMVENMLVADAAEGIGAFLDKRTPEWPEG